MVDQRILDKWLDRPEKPPRCNYLNKFYCLAGGKGPECPEQIRAGAGAYSAATQCENSMFKARYSRAFNERRGRDQV